MLRKIKNLQGFEKIVYIISLIILLAIVFKCISDININSEQHSFDKFYSAKCNGISQAECIQLYRYQFSSVPNN